MKSLTEYLEECLNYELSKIDESLFIFDGCEILLIDTIELLENNLDKNIIKHKFENLFFNELTCECALITLSYIISHIFLYSTPLEHSCLINSLILLMIINLKFFDYLFKLFSNLLLSWYNFSKHFIDFFYIYIIISSISF